MLKAMPLAAEERDMDHAMARRQVLSAESPQGLVLPVLDITNPAFAPLLSEADIDGEIALYLEEERKRRKAPRWLTRLMYWSAGRKAPLLRAISGARSSYISGLATYMLKLGPNHLAGPFDNRIDRIVAATLPARSTRIRLQHMAELLADGITPALAADAKLPLHFVDIAGGPAMDTLNALILLAERNRELLATRKTHIHILDLDREGPAFAAAALAALKGEDGPLHGLDITVLYKRNDWTATGTLSELLAELRGSGAIVAASSEGGLFEYGSDADIKTNLGALHAGLSSSALVVGSVTRDDEATRMLNSGGAPIKTIPRGLERFSALAEAAGFSVEKSRRSAFADEVLLRKR